MQSLNAIVHAVVVIIGAIIAAVSFAFLIPLDNLNAISGVTIILSVAYGLSFLAWVIVLYYYNSNPENLIWLLTHMMFLVILPATIGATAMNVTSIQNTRNLLAGKTA
jgi:hypothetical protein